MILLLIGKKDLILEKASAIINNTSFILHNNQFKQVDSSDIFAYYKKEYEKCLKNEHNIIFLNHHLVPKDGHVLNRDDIYPEWRELEGKIKKDVVVVYFKNSLPPDYEMEFICFRVSRLNWILVNDKSPIPEIIDGLSNFDENLRIKKI